MALQLRLDSLQNMPLSDALAILDRERQFALPLWTATNSTPRQRHWAKARLERITALEAELKRPDADEREYTFDLTFTFSLTHTIKARDELEAHDLIQNQFGGYFPMDELQLHNVYEQYLDSILLEEIDGEPVKIEPASQRNVIIVPDFGANDEV